MGTSRGQGVCGGECGWQVANGGSKVPAHPEGSSCTSELRSQFGWMPRASMPVGSLGSAARWLSGSIRACRESSRWKASPWVEEVKLPERATLLSFAEGWEGEQRDAGAAIPGSSLSAPERQQVLRVHRVHNRRNNVTNQASREEPSDSAAPCPGVLSCAMADHLGCSREIFQGTAPPPSSTISLHKRKLRPRKRW